DMQGNYSRYLNQKYRDRPWVLFVPFGREGDPGMMAYFRAGPVNWCPRFDAELLEGAGFKLFLRYLENNPVRARLVSKARQYQWSSAAAHCAGHDDSGLLCLERWQHLFARPGFIAEDWTAFVDGPIEEEIRNAAVTASWQSYNRPRGWRRPEVAQSAGSRAG
ncbi:MAG: hypothetical protein K2X03_22605, partial [Bryobacteraceae bacterium]|nr:hypothetical protein [Bryobacteraceae bacterium]